MSDSATREAREAAEKSQTGRCFRMVRLLCSHPLAGMSNKELAAALDTSPANISRDMDLLILLGWGQKLENGRYAITKRPLACMLAAQTQVQETKRHAEEWQSSVTALARQMMP